MPLSSSRNTPAIQPSQPATSPAASEPSDTRPAAAARWSAPARSRPRTSSFACALPPAPTLRFQSKGPSPSHHPFATHSSLSPAEQDSTPVRIERPFEMLRPAPGGTLSTAQWRVPAVSTTKASPASASRKPFSYVQSPPSSHAPPWPCSSSSEVRCPTAALAVAPRSSASRSRSIPRSLGSSPSSCARSEETASFPPTTPHALAPISHPHIQAGLESTTACVRST
mmetsp:Transcript_49554/g.159524  ORF Transcript_49554/g.159524 Transcript_49554/m.159524 type:complete len:226 (+) Transcript_49554:710-1387(+)